MAVDLKKEDVTTSNIQTDKLDLIAQITQIEDIELINKLKNVLSDNYIVPEWQKKELDKRRAAYLKNPEILLDADKVFEELDKEFL